MTLSHSTSRNNRTAMAEFKSVSIESAKNFLTKHHWGVLATRRKNGSLQMSPITRGSMLKAGSSSAVERPLTRSTTSGAIRALPFASLRRPFTAAAGSKSMAPRQLFLFPTLWILWFICSGRFMASTRVGPSSTTEWSVSAESLFAFRSRAWRRCGEDKRDSRRFS